MHPYTLYVIETACTQTHLSPSPNTTAAPSSSSSAVSTTGVTATAPSSPALARSTGEEEAEEGVKKRTTPARVAWGRYYA